MNGLLTDIHDKAQFALPLIPMEYWLFQLNDWNFEFNNKVLFFVLVNIGAIFFIFQLYLRKKYSQKNGQYRDSKELLQDTSNKLEHKEISKIKRIFMFQKREEPLILHFDNRFGANANNLYIISFVCILYGFSTFIYFLLYDNNKNYITWNLFIIFIICYSYLIFKTNEHRLSYKHK